MFKYFSVVLIVLMIFIGCGRPPQTRYFTLEHQLAPQQPISPLPLFVQNFDAGPMLDQDRLLYMTTPYEVKLDPYRRWVQSPQMLLTEKAKLYFKQSGLFQVAQRIPLDREAYELHGRILHFEEVVESTRYARVAVWFEVAHIGTRHVLVSQIIEKRAAISGGLPEDIVRAMSEATFGVFDELAAAVRQALPRE